MADDAVHGAGQHAACMLAHPALGLEALDRLGIDIDQDPRAFAKFLELRKQTLSRRRAPANGVPERIRTSDLRFRKPALYPAELRGRMALRAGFL